MKEIDRVTIPVTVNNFKWKDRYDSFHSIANMSTGHLFNTLKMIWNHTVPAHAKIRPYRKYNFTSFYTTEYMAVAVGSILNELLGRKDLTYDQKYYVHYMIQIAKDLLIYRVEDS